MAGNKKPKKTAARPKRNEIVCVAEFPSPWNNDTEEIGALDGGSWNPSDVDMKAVAHKDVTNHWDVDTLGTFFGAIDTAKDGTLERVILITHSNSSLVAFSGTMSHHNQKGTVGLHLANPSDWIESGGLDQSLATWLKDDPEGQAYCANAKKKFTPNIEIIFISCHAGGSTFAPPLFMVDFATALQARVKAFTEDIRYTPDYPNGTITDRTITAVGINGKKGKGFRHLLTSSNLRTVNPQ